MTEQLYRRPLSILRTALVYFARAVRMLAELAGWLALWVVVLAIAEAVL